MWTECQGLRPGGCSREAARRGELVCKGGGNRAVWFRDVRLWGEQLLKRTHKENWKISAMCKF